MKGGRINVLDSLRGIACLQVVLGHCLIAIPGLAWLVYEQESQIVDEKLFYIGYSPLNFFWNATPAVIVFFVLSGFVLSLPYYEGKPFNNYVSFFVKRVLRLYIPCLVIILTSVLLKFILYKPGVLSAFNSWLTEIWKEDISITYFIKLLQLNTYFNNVDPALWTLPIEIKLSLILPLFIYLFKHLNMVFSILTVSGWVILYHVLVKVGLAKVWPDFSTMYYFSFFLLGSFLCKYKSIIINFINCLPSWMFYTILILAVFVYTGNYSLWWLPAKAFAFFKGVPEDYRSALPAIIFVSFSLSKRAESFLNRRELLFIGKISFSLYLVHQVSLAAFAYILSNYISSNIAVIFISLILSFGFAIVFYNYVEVSSLDFAKKASNFFSVVR